MHIRMDLPRSFDWNRMRAFLATAKTGSLSAAARQLGLTQPTLGRQVTALEEELGVVLFERAGRGLIVTPAGQDLMRHAETMGDAADKIALVASGRSQTVAGQVRITASDMISAHTLPPFLKRVQAAAPRLEIEVVAANDLRDLLRREADIAIRHVRPEQPDLIARRMQDASAHFYAAATYLDARGRPRTLSDLRHHDFLSFGDPEQMLAHLNPLGLDLERANFRLGSNSGLVTWEYARQGLGIVPMSDDIGAATPGMERVLPGMDPLTFPVWLTTHRELHKSRRIRLVFDMLAAFLDDPVRPNAASRRR